ncbi:uncharacterized protein TNCV_2687921 [Trichonephila clavipes]|nr:uncharacterized protein TNCV_2687921 [Trichonephila clavipes]
MDCISCDMIPEEAEWSIIAMNTICLSSHIVMQRDCAVGAINIQIRNLTGVKEALESGINWLRSYKATPWNWGDDISRAAIAFFLTSYSNFNGTNLEEELIAKQVELRTTLFLLRTKEKTNINELSMFINALLVTCYNPQDFYGTDLVNKLKTDVEASKTFTNPLAYLALCKANGTWPETAVANLNKVLNNSRQPFMIGTFLNLQKSVVQ